MRKLGSPPPGMSNRQAKYLRNRLSMLGFRSYLDYLESDHWKDMKARYRASVRPEPGYREQGLPQTCIVCRDVNVDLHHKTYQRLGEEKLTDLVPLCRNHHDQLHDEGLNLWDGPGILYKRELEERSNGRFNSVANTP